MAKPSRHNQKTPATQAAVPASRPTLGVQPAANQPNGQSNVNTTKPNVRIESKPASEPSSVTPSAIAEAAYFLWLQRGGNESVNWLEAECLLRTKVAAR